MPTALVTGVTGQDGSYLAEKLLSLGYEVHGVTRSTGKGLGSAEHLRAQLTLHVVSGDAQADWERLADTVQPDEVYHLAADSFVPNGWSHPIDNVASNLTLTIRILEALRQACPTARFLNACSREIFGNTSLTRASEETSMQPLTPYGINKAASRWFALSYRDKYRMFVTNAILFNHESPRRPVSFVTRKITRGVAEIHLGFAKSIELGNVTARRDWGFAGDYVDAMWRMLQLDHPHDFVLGSGVTHSIAEFAQMAFQAVDLNWQDHVVCSAALKRSHDTASLAADCTKARRLLGWHASTDLATLARVMVQHDIDLLQQQQRRVA